MDTPGLLRSIREKRSHQVFLRSQSFRMIYEGDVEKILTIGKEFS